MKRYSARLALLLGSIVLVALANAWALVLALIGHDRALRVAVGNDQTANAAAGGSEDETISSRAGKAQRAGRRWGCILCRVLDKVDPGHCSKSIELDEGKPLEVDPPEAGATPQQQ